MLQVNEHARLRLKRLKDNHEAFLGCLDYMICPKCAKGNLVVEERQPNNLQIVGSDKPVETQKTHWFKCDNCEFEFKIPEINGNKQAGTKQTTPTI